jgi:hypothetical protein
VAQLFFADRAGHPSIGEARQDMTFPTFPNFGMPMSEHGLYLKTYFQRFGCFFPLLLFSAIIVVWWEIKSFICHIKATRW